LLTSDFAEVQMGFSDREVCLERCDLLPQDQQVLDDKQLAIQGSLQMNTKT
jgi:hypothetical protein